MRLNRRGWITLAVVFVAVLLILNAQLPTEQELMELR